MLKYNIEFNYGRQHAALKRIQTFILSCGKFTSSITYIRTYNQNLIMTYGYDLYLVSQLRFQSKESWNLNDAKLKYN